MEESLSEVKDEKSECPECGYEHLVYNISKNASWGSPNSPATAMCRDCGQKFELGLVPVE